MNRLTFIFPTILSVFVSLLFFTSCSKDGPGDDGTEPEKEFTELNENEQKAYLIKEFSSRGGDYFLTTVTTYDANGDVELGYNPENCERSITVTVPNGLDKNLTMKQVAPEGACGKDYSDIIHNVVRLTFSNYKAAIGFYTVQKDENPENYMRLMYFDPADNTDSKYLVLTSFRDDDFERMNNGEPNIKARRYKKYVFQKK